jgi:hypothetical protein
MAPTLVIALASSLAFASADSAKAVRPALKLRGGLAGVDPATAAMVGTVLTGVNGAYCGIAPEPAAQAYGMKSVPFEVVQIIKSLGYTFISAAILAVLSLKGKDLGTALASSSVPWVILTLDNIWNGVAAKMGQPAFAPIMLLAINVAVLYCSFTGTAVPLAANLYAGWCALNGMFFALAPEKGAEAWGMKASAQFAAMMKNFGYSLASFAVLLASLANGVGAPQAIGYSFAVMLLSILDGLFVSKTFEVVSDDKTPGYVWMVIQAAVIALTLA